MKKLIAFLGFLSLVIIFNQQRALAQIRQLPTAVKEAFERKYTDVKEVNYDDKIVYVQVRFTTADNKQCTARFTSKGVWQFTERDMKFEELPAPVQDGFNKSKYADWQVDHVYLVNLPDNKTQYKVQAEKTAVQKRNLYFSTKGRLQSDNITMY